MKKSNKILAAATGIACLFVVAGTSLSSLASKKGCEHTIDEQHIQSSELLDQSWLSAQQAMTIALTNVPGKVLEAEIIQDNNILAWEVDVISNTNEIYEFRINADNGRILRKEAIEI